MRLRIAGIIVLLYAQPLTRVVRLTIDDVLHDGGTWCSCDSGNRPHPIPAPVALPLLQEYIAGRANMTTATNPASRWLFPGRRAGQPMPVPTTCPHPGNEVGVPAAAARGAAIRQQLLEMPVPRRRRRSGLPPRSPPPGYRPGRRHLEPIRRRRPRTAAIRKPGEEDS